MIGFNPFDSEESFKKTYALQNQREKWNAVQCLSKSIYLIDKLFVMMDLPVSNIVNNVYYTEMKYAEKLMELNGTDISKLTPYGPNGIAIRGELDYRP